MKTEITSDPLSAASSSLPQSMMQTPLGSVAQLGQAGQLGQAAGQLGQAGQLGHADPLQLLQQQQLMQNGLSDQLNNPIALAQQMASLQMQQQMISQQSFAYPVSFKPWA